MRSTDEQKTLSALYLLRSLGAILAATLLASCESGATGNIRCGQGTYQVGDLCVTDARSAPPRRVSCGTGTHLVAGECLPTTSSDSFPDLIDPDSGPFGDLPDALGGDDAGEPLRCIPAPESAASLGACVTLGAAGFPCNPVTNDGCNTAKGERCDLDIEGARFRCLQGTGTLASCAPCDFDKIQCPPAHTCQGSTGGCQRYCCDDADCGEGSCIPTGLGNLGLCQGERDGFSFVAIGGLPLACNLPHDAPSLGSCSPQGDAAKCNPVTGASCNLAAGETCDFDGNGFACLPGPSTVPLCGECGAEAVCMVGHTCLGGRCARYCCTDDDCAPGVCGRSTTGASGPELGTCLEASAPDAGLDSGDGSGDAGEAAGQHGGSDSGR